MYCVFVIKSLSRNYIYVGLTNNMERRLKEHNNGENKTTKPYSPFFLILEEKYNTGKGAREMEKYFKNGTGKEYIKSLLK